MPEPRDILHVDMDAFFASVEQVLDPALKGKPVVVGGAIDGRGVVSSASYEARKYGVRSAMPVGRARRLCPDAIFIRGSFDAYVEFSGRVRAVLDRFAPAVEAVSVDDFYLDLTGCRRLHGMPIDAAGKIRAAVEAETGLSVSIGIAENKLTAKVASGFAKPAGIVEVWRGYEAAFLRPLPIRKLPGVGPRTAETLLQFNLTTIGALAGMPRDLLEQTFGSSGAYLWAAANGRDDSPVTPVSGPPKSVGREHTFARDVDDRRKIRAMLFRLVERAGRQLRDESLAARRVTLKLRYADFETATAAASLADPADGDDVFYRAAVELADRLMAKRRLRVRLIGVALSRLIAGAPRQGDLFAGTDIERRRRFYRGLDRLREKFGEGIARLGPGIAKAEHRRNEKNRKSTINNQQSTIGNPQSPTRRQ